MLFANHSWHFADYNASQREPLTIAAYPSLKHDDSPVDHSRWHYAYFFLPGHRKQLSLKVSPPLLLAHYRRCAIVTFCPERYEL
jgi:hypothetical protein